MSGFSKKLRDIARRAQELKGQQRVSFDQLFSPSFMRRHTDVSTLRRARPIIGQGCPPPERSLPAACPLSSWPSRNNGRGPTG